MLIDRDGRGMARPGGVLLHGEAPFRRSLLRGGCWLAWQHPAYAAAHGRTAQGLLSIIGSADAGHITYTTTDLRTTKDYSELDALTIAALEGRAIAVGRLPKPSNAGANGK